MSCGCGAVSHVHAASKKDTLSFSLLLDDVLYLHYFSFSHIIFTLNNVVRRLPM